MNLSLVCKEGVISSDKLHEEVSVKFDRLSEKFDIDLDIQVSLQKIKSFYHTSAKLTVHRMNPTPKGKRTETYVSSSKAEDLFPSIDILIKKLEKQLQKDQTKMGRSTRESIRFNLPL